MSTMLRTEVSGRLGRVWLTRGSKRNALSHEFADEFDEVLDGFIEREVVVVVIRATGKAFCAGNDTTELSAPGTTASDRIVARILGDDLFFVAAVEAPAFGAGVSIVATCPVVIATDTSWFALPERNLGLFASGVMAFLEPLVGSRIAVELGVLGEPMSAERAHALGLVNEVVPASQIEGAISRWVDALMMDAHVTRQAGRAWRSRFATENFRTRKAHLDSLLSLPKSS